jgi:5-methylcytosine-specific restriction protein A
MRNYDLARQFPHLQNVAGMPICRWCRKELAGRRKSWCSETCKDEALIRCWPSHARFMVGQRDHGVCALCGIDTEKLRNRVRVIYWKLRQRGKLHQARRIERIFISNGWPGLQRSWWEADHIKPVCQGGGECGLENYRTLCVPCHKKETAKLRKQISIKNHYKIN